MYFDKAEWGILPADEPKVYGGIVEGTVQVLTHDTYEDLYSAYIQVPFAFHTFLRQNYPDAERVQFFVLLPPGIRGVYGKFGFYLRREGDDVARAVDLWVLKATPNWLKPFSDGHVPFVDLL